MLTRIITSILGLGVFALVLWAGPVAFTIAIAIIVLFMLFELYRTIKSHIALNVAGFICSGILLSSIIFGNVSLELTTAVGIGIYLAVMVFLHTTVSYKDVCSHGFLSFFITIFFGTMIRIYNDFGVVYVILIFICAWGTDTCAYFTGRAFGRHKLIPKVSPKKTVEGAIGGVIGAALLCMLYLFVLNILSIQSISEMNYVNMLIIGAVTSVFSQIGDFVASSIKRDCDAKDFGNILPGHGGVLDRFDSVIYITPVIYYALVIILK